MWSDVPHLLESYGFERLSTRDVFVLGPSCPNEDSRRQKPTGTPVSRAFVKWLNVCGLKYSNIRFLGPFTQRRLSDDGTLIADLQEDSSEGLIDDSESNDREGTEEGQGNGDGIEHDSDTIDGYSGVEESLGTEEYF